MSHIVAVDGGNSKTDVAVLRDDGAVLALVRGDGSSPHQLGLDRALDVVDELLTRAWRDAGLGARDQPADVIAMFMAGADLPEEALALELATAARKWARTQLVANDVFALLWAATGGGDGVAVTVGAGVNGVGHSPSGAIAWFPSLGDITGDWGGGAGIGLAALGAGVRSEDLRGPATTLAAGVAHYFGAERAVDVAVAIHEDRLDRGRLTELPPIVVAAALAGDAVALEILRRQADEVATLAIAALTQLGMTSQPVDIVLGGSVLAASGDVVMERITTTIAAQAPRATVTLCTARPVAGAAIAALHLAGADQAAKDRARAAIGNAGEEAA